MVIIRQPFGHELYRGIVRAHNKYLAKTVMVKNGDVDAAMKLLNRMLHKEGIITILRETERFEKPTTQRWNFGRNICIAVYNEDMRRKIEFVKRKYRPDPFPGQY